MQNLSEWIYGTPLSAAIRDNTWAVPLVQSIHICAIAVVVGSALITELRIAGVVAADESLSVVAQRYLPWMWRALVVLLLTGVLLVVGEPDRELHNVPFWIKMALVLMGVVASLGLRRPLLRPLTQSSRAPAKALAWIMLALWGLVIFCGRWIAYSN